MAVKHIVLIKFRAEIAATERQRCTDAFAQLPGAIEGITGFEQGANISTEDRSKGFNHVANITFQDSKARDAYLPHPAHKAFVALLRPLVDDVLIFDYEV